MKYEHWPISLEDAAEFTDEHHRHSKPLKRHKFSIGAFARREPEPGFDWWELIGVASVNACSSAWSKDVTKRWYGDDQNIARCEIVRLVVTEGNKNLCSFLYSKALQACFAMGYEEVVTYTQKHESGSSAKASGFKRHEWIENPKVNMWIKRRNN
tara:strand:+ start:75 stop:539 length:465 start_codon:yes stop_codon:yes gene_type:complete